jgi:predicted  nucleic acid-binding Zn-ribbon protein
MKTLEQAVDDLSETIKEASEMIKSLREENKKQKDALDYVKQWLNENIDEGSPDGVKYDSANLLQNVKELLGE